MIVAVIPVLVVEMSADKIVGMVPVRDSFVPAIFIVFVGPIVRSALMSGGAFGRIVGGYRDLMLFGSAVFLVMHVTVVQVVGVVIVSNGGMPASRIVGMDVGFVSPRVSHGSLLDGFRLSQLDSLGQVPRCLRISRQNL